MNNTTTTSANSSVEAAAAAVAPVAQTHEPTFNLTASDLQNLMADAVARALASQGAASAPARVSDPGARGPVATADGRATQILGLVEQAVSKVVTTTRDRVVARTTNFLVQKAGPHGLALIAAGSTIAGAGARVASDALAHLADSLAAKSATINRR